MNMEDFETILFTEDQVSERVAQLGEEINKCYGDNPVLIISVLKGSAPFAVDLMKHLKMDVMLDFIAASSYGAGTNSSGHLTITKDITFMSSETQKKRRKRVELKGTQRNNG